MQVERIAAPPGVGAGSAAGAAASGAAAFGAGQAGGAAGAGAAGFEALLAGREAQGAGGVSGQGQASGVPVATQAGEDAYVAAYQAEMADRNARRHGRAMLKGLAALQVAMLGGSAAEARQALAALASGGAPAHDPVLRLILREIGARAAAELGRGA